MKRIRRAVFMLVSLAAVMVALLAVFLAVEVLRTRQAQSEPRIATDADGHYVHGYDTEIYVRRSGVPSAPVVVFISGTAAFSDMWQSITPRVVALGYQTIAVDLPPFGHSLPPASGNYRKDEQGRRLWGLLDTLGVEKVTFVAHSIGAAPTMEAVLSRPDRVQKLVLVSPALGLDQPQTDGSESGVQRWLRRHWLADTLSACCVTNPDFTAALVKHFVAEKDKVTDAWVEQFRRGFRVQGADKATAAWLPELVAPRAHLRSDELSSYRQLAVPTLIVWGKDDEVTPLSQGEHLHGLMRASTLAIVPGGHVPMIEERERFLAVLSDALAGAPH